MIYPISFQCLLLFPLAWKVHLIENVEEGGLTQCEKNVQDVIYLFIFYFIYLFIYFFWGGGGGGACMCLPFKG